MLTGDVRAYVPAFAPHHVAPFVPRRASLPGTRPQDGHSFSAAQIPTRSTQISDVRPSACSGLRDRQLRRQPRGARERGLPVAHHRPARRGTGQCFSTPFTRRSSPTPVMPGHGPSMAGPSSIPPAPSSRRISSSGTRFRLRRQSAPDGVMTVAGCSATARRCTSASARRSSEGRRLRADS